MTVIWQSVPILSKILILIRWTIMIPFLFALTFFILLTLVFVIIPGLFLSYRWISILANDGFKTGDMKVPTFYSPNEGGGIGHVLVMSAVGVVFGGIHCAGWFFYFPSSGEAILWRVCSVVLTVIAFQLPLNLTFSLLPYIDSETSRAYDEWPPSAIVILTNILLVYVASRLLLLVEAFISLRDLIPGMLALVKWTSFIPHI